ncbi:MAG: hypothetical protein ACP5RI_02480 [Candidatus Micrarchaeia archaeon]
MENNKNNKLSLAAIIIIIIVVIGIVAYQNFVSNSLNSTFKQYNSSTPSSTSSSSQTSLGLLAPSTVDSILGGSWQTKISYQGTNLSKIPPLRSAISSGMLSGGFEELEYNNQTLNITYVNLNTSAYADKIYNYEMGILNADVNGTLSQSTYMIRLNKLGGQEILYAKYYNNIIMFFYANKTNYTHSSIPSANQATQLLNAELST